VWGVVRPLDGERSLNGFVIKKWERITLMKKDMRYMMMVSTEEIAPAK